MKEIENRVREEGIIVQDFQEADSKLFLKDSGPVLAHKDFHNAMTL